MSNPFESPESFDSATPVNRTRLRLKRVGVMSFALFFGVAGVLMGVIAGIFSFLISLISNATGPDANTVLPGAAIGAGMLIAMPILYGVMGFVGGAINAAVYNIVAGFSGGIELEFSQV